MTVVIVGGSGFLGQRLTQRLTSAGRTVVVLTRRAASARGASGARFVTWNPEAPDGAWAHALEGAGAVVNLAGANLAEGRWTSARKAELRSSRIVATRALAEAIARANRPPSVVIQGSAVGFYGSTAGDRLLDESSPAGGDFLASLCVDWEAAACPVVDRGCRLVIVRTGVVLSREEGALAKLRWPFIFFVGGPLASGRQYLSWIHVDDWTNIVACAVESAGIAGVVNATAPTPTTNEDFSRALGRALGRPSWVRVPGFALRALVGEMADDALIGGQRVRPARLLAEGFHYAHPSLDEALVSALDC